MKSEFTSIPHEPHWELEYINVLCRVCFLNHIEALRHWQPPYHSDLSCPICLQTATFPVETNCGHLFCGSCLITYWKHGSWLGAINCPLCRQKVRVISILYISFLTVSELREEIPRVIFFADYLYDMPLLLNLALRGIFTLGGLVWIFFLRIVVCSFGTIMCLTSRFDVMHESLCGILAAVDDLVVVFLLLICMFNICQQMESEGINMASSTTQTMLSES
uniref:RING-type domain-containing protein n=1 Tax=Chrysemys picta bellii TaxID=8478 RepID=A0A8C3HKW8_CHRPI